MLKYRNFGKKSLNEIKDKLQQLGLGLGQEVRSRSGGNARRWQSMVPARTDRGRSGISSLGKIMRGEQLMRHQKKTVKLGRTAEHRKALLANQVCSLIEHQRIKTTLAKAKAVRPLAEKMVTLGKKGRSTRAGPRSRCCGRRMRSRNLFDDIAPRSAERKGGYTRIIKLGAAQERLGARVAFIEWVDAPPADG